MAIDKKVLKELAALRAKKVDNESEIRLARMELLTPALGRRGPQNPLDMFLDPRKLIRTAELSTEWGRLNAKADEMKAAHPTEHAAFSKAMERQPKLRVRKSAMPNGAAAIEVFANAMIKTVSLQHTLHLLSRLDKNVADSLKMQGISTRLAYPVEKGEEREGLVKVGMPKDMKLTDSIIEELVYPTFLKNYVKSRDEYRSAFKDVLPRTSLVELHALDQMLDGLKEKTPEQHDLFKRMIKVEKAGRRQRLERRVLRRAGA